MTSMTEAGLATASFVPAYATQPAAVVAPQPAVQPMLPTVTGGGGQQAVQGAGNLNDGQLAAALNQLLSALQQLAAVLQAQQGARVSGGGAAASAGCGCGCGAAHAGAQQGAAGAPEAAPAPARSEARESAPTAASPTSAQRVDPSTVKDKSSTNGLNAAAKRGLEEAHTFGLPLVSGKRSGGGKSDHDHGNAIDVGTLPIGVASSDGGTPQMKAFAEHMRQMGKAGKLNVKYVIADGKIASSRDGWAWRPYTYPGKTEAQLAALKQSNRGEYNRIQHYDHVHVSFG